MAIHSRTHKRVQRLASQYRRRSDRNPIVCALGVHRKQNSFLGFLKEILSTGCFALHIQIIIWPYRVHVGRLRMPPFVVFLLAKYPVLSILDNTLHFEF